MAHFVSAHPASLFYSLDQGETWVCLDNLLDGGSIFLLDQDDDPVEIKPDNPLYDELLEILEKE